MPFKVFTNGVPLPASDLNDYLMEQAIATFADATARDAAIVAPLEGQLAYTADNDTYWSYTGSAWSSFGGGFSLLSTTTLTGASVTISSIPTNYTHLYMYVTGFRPSTGTVGLRMRLNGSSTGYINGAGTGSTASDTSMTVSSNNISSLGGAKSAIWLFDYNESGYKVASWNSVAQNAGTPTYNAQADEASWITGGAVTSLTFLSASGNLGAGTVKLYGVK